MQKDHKKCTTSLMIWSQKLAQQTAQLTTRKSTTKPTTFRLKEHNFPDHFCTTTSQEKIKTSNWFYIWHRPQLHQQKKHKKCTTSLMIWSQKLAQQTSQLHQQKKHKKCTNSLMIWSQKLAQQTAQLTTRKSTKKTQRLGLKSTTSQPKSLQQQPPPNPQVVLNLQSTGLPAQPEPGSFLRAVPPVSVASSGTR